MVLKKGNITKNDLSKKALNLLLRNLMRKGLSIKSEKVLHDLFLLFKRTRNIHGNVVLSSLISEVKPVVSLKRKKVGGIQYRIPVYLEDLKGSSLAVKWVVSSSCGRKLGPRFDRLSVELNSILNLEGRSLEKKQSLYDQALLNRAYIKYL